MSIMSYADRESVLVGWGASDNDSIVGDFLLNRSLVGGSDSAQLILGSILSIFLREASQTHN